METIDSYSKLLGIEAGMKRRAERRVDIMKRFDDNYKEVFLLRRLIERSIEGELRR